MGFLKRTRKSCVLRSLPVSDTGTNPRFGWVGKLNLSDYPGVIFDEFDTRPIAEAKTSVDTATQPPRIQTLLRLAFTIQERLRKESGLTMSGVAREMGITPTRVTQIMNLLKLAPSIQEHILKLPPVNGKEGLSEKHTRTLC